MFKIYKKIVSLAVAVISLSVNAGEPASFDFTSIPVGQAVSLYYKEISTKPYIVCDEVLTDSRLVSVRAAGKTLDGPAVAAFLDYYGYSAVDHGGVVVVCKKKEQVQKMEDTYEPFLYMVKHRDPGYLVDLLSPLVKGTFANRRQGNSLAVGGQTISGAGTGTQSSSSPGAVGTPASSSSTSALAGGQSAIGDDYLVFSGPPGEVRKLRLLLEQLDTSVGEVLVKAYMYEVGTNSGDASALQLVVSALGGRVGAAVPGDVVGNLLRLRTSSVDAVASSLATDSRFKVVAAPFVRLRSGKTARFVAGDQQSIQGAITTTASGVSQQSFDRVESGTILEVSPVVRGVTVDVDLFEQVSSFQAAARTSTSQAPILNKRELRTSLSMVDGEVVVMGGLNNSKTDNSSSGLRFLPFALAKSSASTSTELVLVLEMKRL